MSDRSGEILSLNVGMPVRALFEGREWISAIRKESVSKPLLLNATQLEGDAQANRRYHGGPDKAVCCFSDAHYLFWKEETGAGDDFIWGAFGENFTLAGMTEEEVCIGDNYEVGQTRVQVASPRAPCNNLSWRWNCPDMPEKMMDLGHSGFYLRVLQTGIVAAGDSMRLLDRPHPTMTIAHMNDLRFGRVQEFAAFQAASALPELAEDWAGAFRRILSRL